MAELRARNSKLARSGPQSGGAAFGEGGRRNSARLRLVESAVDDGIFHGTSCLDAEDEELSGRFVTLRGRRQVNFGSCSYLGLETDPRLKNAACDAVSRYGVQFSSSRAYVSCPPYRELERLLRALFEAPVVVAPTTTLGHFSALPILIEPEDAVVCDQFVHNSVQSVLPTLKLAGTSCGFVRHNRIDRLDEMVGALAERHRRVWYLADGVYSMRGDRAPMAALHELASRHDQLCYYIDDAHGLSWTGRHGRGTVLGGGPKPPRTVVAAGFAKAFGANGAVLVSQDEETSALIRKCGSPMIFSGPVPPPVLGAAIASARIHLSDEIHDLQRQLMERIQLFNRLAGDRGLELGSPDETPIRLVKVGVDAAAYQIAAALMDEGFYTNTALFPAVSRGGGGLRVALTLHQTMDDIRALVDGIARRV
jgi:7-keto-8-aminopelargonate synthetase-like enzyme